MKKSIVLTLLSLAVVFEIDIEQAKTPQFAQKLLRGNMYAGDDDLTKHLKPETVKKLEAFLQGENMALDALAEVALADWKDEFPAVYQEIMVDRNNNWMPQIKKMFETKESEFVLVGALHLAGEDGLLAMLKKQGYQVRQME